VIFDHLYNDDSVPGFWHELLPGVAGILTIPALLGLAGRFARRLAPSGRPVSEAWRVGCLRNPDVAGGRAQKPV